MTVITSLHALLGDWQGPSKLWLMPTDPVRESQSVATVAEVAQGQSLVIRYNWEFEGQPQDGMLALVPGGQPEVVRAIWLDSWHMANSYMLCEGSATDTGISVKGSYQAPPGPDWGWRIVLEPQGNAAWRLLMFNLSPDGQEYPAVEAVYTRAGK